MEIRKNKYNPLTGITEVEISVTATRENVLRSFTGFRVIVFDLSNGSRIYTQNFNKPENSLLDKTTQVKLMLELPISSGKKIEIQVYQETLILSTFSSSLEWKGLDKKTIVTGDGTVVTKEVIAETTLDKALDLAQIGLVVGGIFGIAYLWRTFFGAAKND